jgi:hypothetical protein
MRKFAKNKFADCASIADIEQLQNASKFELRDLIEAAHRGRSCAPCKSFQISVSPKMDIWIAVELQAFPRPDARTWNIT